MRGTYGFVMGTVAGLTMAVATAHAGTEALDGYAGAKDQIMSYYAANAREGAGNCGAGQMTSIGDAKVIESAGDKVVLAVDYGYSATAEADPTACTGTSQREFTLTKAGSGYEVTGMTGNTP